MNSKIEWENQNGISPLKKQKPRAKEIVCRSAFRRRHAKAASFSWMYSKFQEELRIFSVLLMRRWGVEKGGFAEVFVKY